MKPGLVYVVTNNTAIYIGVTANITGWILQHKDKINATSFTARHNLKKWFIKKLFKIFKMPLQEKNN